MINQIDSSVLQSVNGNQAARRSESDDLHKNFMTLLTTQLRNQDPLNPMENAEMTSQLAQINTVSGIEKLNDTMDVINRQIDADRFMQASSLIGKAVLVPGNQMMMGDEGNPTPFAVDLKEPAAEVKVRIMDMNGNVVREFNAGSSGSGLQTIGWDGNLADGTRAPAGAYRFSVEALNDGRAVSYDSLNYAEVVAVSTGHADGLRLDLGGIFDPVRLDDIRQVI
ncbi:MAG: flagellar hook assembly protein FlgD [Aliidiomarina sp.]|uniref:flagellar hook assembly protein FlgD n=1 Tax=Aliidiomarina sp. TaxID=1872439 RepID=UPI0025C407BF|nr:flagellar hook assembly protein FlgD [Aliidiomarina sp.]MCH8501031.1 flagellar hook assembly protein FlgD [Aliidiomarina sp.]